MTDKELKAKILAEIERLINDLGEQRDINLEDLRDFINSLPEESGIEISYDEKINEAHRLGREEGMFLAKTMFSNR